MLLHVIKQTQWGELRINGKEGFKILMENKQNWKYLKDISYFINWNVISRCRTLIQYKDFMREFKQYINWQIFMDVHNMNENKLKEFLENL